MPHPAHSKLTAYPVNIKHHLPNALTLLNVFCGSAAVVCIFNGYYGYAFWFLFAGGWADFFDGFVARALKVPSTLGKELDSLADMVSFGLVPGVIYYALLSYGWHQATPPFDLHALALPGFLVTMFAALRLAKFNLDTRQTEDFIGMPTPAVTVFSTGMMLVFAYDLYGLREVVSSPWLVYPVVVGLSWILISEFPMFSMKFKGVHWRGNEYRWIFLILALNLFIILRAASFVVVILVYIALSAVRWWRMRSA